MGDDFLGTNAANGTLYRNAARKTAEEADRKKSREPSEFMREHYRRIVELIEREEIYLAEDPDL